MAQYSFIIDFNLEIPPSESLLHFASPEGANIVLAAQTSGGYLISAIQNIREITITMPKLNESTSFSSTDDAERIRRNMVIYNFSCSLNSYTLIHYVDIEQNRLVIQMTTDNERDYELLKPIIQRFGGDVTSAKP